MAFTVEVRDSEAAIVRLAKALRENGGELLGGIDGGEFYGKTRWGRIEGNYFKLNLLYTVEITRKPWLVSHAAIERRIREYFKE